MGSAAPKTTFRPIGALADAEVLRLAGRCGRCSVRLVTWLRGHGAIRTLPEIWEELQIPLPELTATLFALEAAGLIQRRDMTMDHGTEPVWWAPLVLFAAAVEAPGMNSDKGAVR